MRALISTEREAINRRYYAPTDHDTLRSALARRTDAIYQQAISERPEWLIELLTDLDDCGTLEQLRPAQVRQLVLDRAKTVDLALEGLAPASALAVERAPGRTV